MYGIPCGGHLCATCRRSVRVSMVGTATRRRREATSVEFEVDDVLF